MADYGLPDGAEQVIANLAGDRHLWLSDVPNRGPRREPLYATHPGIRGTGVYVISDVECPAELYYIGKVVQDRADPGVTNPNADGIIGRLSGHQNMAGSNVLARWFAYLHVGEDVPPQVRAGDLRDRIRAEAAPRLQVRYSVCSRHLATAIERHLIRHGLPDRGVPPVLNSPNWERARASSGKPRQAAGAHSRQLTAIDRPPEDQPARWRAGTSNSTESIELAIYRLLADADVSLPADLVSRIAALVARA